MSVTEQVVVESHLTDTGEVKNGTYTLVSDKSGEHRTLRIATAQNGNLKGTRIISMLTGPNNEADFTGVGFVDKNKVAVWGRFRGTLTGDIANCLMAILVRGKTGDDGAVRVEGISGHVLFKSSCMICNRPLTCPVSIRTGIGPVCAERM